jgi:transcriptional regulator with XRE-family HTH domain
LQTPPVPAASAVTRLGSFDADAFYTALDLQRAARRLTWKQVAAQAGISPSTLTRMKQGKRPDVDSMAALAAWAGLDVDDYVSSSDRGEAASLPRISALLRADPHLSPESATAIEELLRMTYERLREDARR